jgi:hypothetical protein
MGQITPFLLPRLAAAPVIALTLLLAGCDSDKERIDRQNEAARTAAAEQTASGEDDDPEPTRDVDSDPRDVSVFDLRVGDCLTEDAIFAGDPEDEFGEETETQVVDCGSIDAFGRVAKLHLIDAGDDADYPGDDAMIAIAEEECLTPGQPYTYYTPTRQSWDEGDRAITCIETTVFAYDVGSCVSGEDDGYRVLPCDVEEDLIFADVVRIVDVSAEYGPDALLPEETYWDEVFDRDCADDADFFLYPTAETWDTGDRLVVCVLTR